MNGPSETNEIATALAVVPPSFADVQVAAGLSSPTQMAIAPDGRIFVSEQAGRLRVIKNGVLLASPFLSLSVSNAGERGLLGTAFDPNFANNQYIYVFYTHPSGPHNRVSRFTANGDMVVPGSETVILAMPTLSFATNHNGGSLHFGTDGKLYVSVGDNANGNHAQNMGTILGKILRINSDGTIPTDNPFYGSATGNYRSIWALGMRNPFTFAVQPGTGRIFVNDVGQDSWEEINDVVKGGNYGWPLTEGYTSDPRFRTPYYAYGHGNGCAVTGGAFYNPQTNQFPSAYTGNYFYAEDCHG